MSVRRCPMLRIVSATLVLIGLATLPVFRLPSASAATSSLSPLDLYRRAVNTMSKLDEPAYVAFNLTAISQGLQTELSPLCMPCLHVRANFANSVHWSVVHRTADYLNAVRNDADGKRYVSYNPDVDPTWYGTFRALRTGMITTIGDYTVPPAPAPIVRSTPRPAKPSTLRTIAAIRVIGPGIYRVSDNGTMPCPNGDPGHALHLTSRADNPREQLSDVIVDLRSMRFCMVRLTLAGPTMHSGNASWEEHFGDVGGYWMVTDGLYRMQPRINGMLYRGFHWAFRLTDMRFPPALPPTTFDPIPRTTLQPATDYAQAHRLVSIGGRHLNVYCSGNGPITVVLDARAAHGLLEWRYVQPQLAASARVCSYDRAGIGFSDPGPFPRDADADASDLHALVASGAIARPFVLAGYSGSTYATRIYADRYPNDLLGIVLIEPPIDVHAAALTSVAPALRPTFAQDADYRAVCPHAFAQPNFSPDSALYTACMSPPDADLPPDLAALQTLQTLRPDTWNTRFSEQLSVASTSAQEAHVQQRNYGALPLELIVARDAFPPGPYLPTAQRNAEVATLTALRMSPATYTSRASRTRIVGCSHDDVVTACASSVVTAIDDFLHRIKPAT